ncbi:DUF3617 domain-containing protein [Chitinilyticum piscinae]|uniref:DUF3617 family protein n=1 Tax=Chitinilyticum piscinae TaxID=2866724 RepID=A0A8J7FLV8_9NEIS|nr:DUF3617 family protein [Chitinilyticum piscinae]MBE9608731.1 DUF3617 family protein [Chitinilyticum piscinae]
MNRLLPALALPLLASLATAAELPPIMPALGQWQVTTDMPPDQKAAMQQMDEQARKAMQQRGMSIDPKAGTMTMTLCLNQQTIHDWNRMGKEHAAQTRCDPPAYSTSGNTLTMDMRCSKPRAMSMHAVYQFSPARDAYTFEQQMQSEGRSMTMKGKARRSGDC